MKFSPYVTDLLKQKSDKEFRISGDCEFLSLDIESVTGEHIGVNTLKRLLGFIADEREPRISTLDVIARYLGFENWEVLSIYDNRSNSSFESSSEEIRVSDLPMGQHIQISYLPDRQVEVVYLGANRFRVQESINSKLRAGDELTANHIVQDYPLLVSDVLREGQSLGSFTAGKAQGIRFKIL